MAGSFMAQFVSFVDIVIHQEEDVSAVSYPVLLTPVSIRLSMQLLVSYKPTNQCYLVNSLLPIVDFDHHLNPVTLSRSGPSIAGSTFSLTCSANLTSPIPLPSDVPSPKFEWFFGPHGNASLPSGVTPTTTDLKNCNIYTSTLQFSPALNKFHSGMYTCRLGAGQLANSTVVYFNGMN